MLSIMCFFRCLKCKRLEPLFMGAARKLSKHTPPILFGTVDVPKNMDTAKKVVEFHDFPVIVMYRYGRQYKYNGPDDSEEGKILITITTTIIIIIITTIITTTIIVSDPLTIVTLFLLQVLYRT